MVDLDDVQGSAVSAAEALIFKMLEVGTIGGCIVTSADQRRASRACRCATTWLTRASFAAAPFKDDVWR
jgi:hypothetical protein